MLAATLIMCVTTLVRSDRPAAAPKVTVTAPAPAPAIAWPDLSKLLAVVSRLEAMESSRIADSASPIVLASDYAKLSAIIERLNAIEKSRGTSRSSTAISASGASPSDFFQEFALGGAAPASGATSSDLELAIPLPNNTRWDYAASAPIAENGSYFGQLNASGIPKTVHVNGYLRGNGTYVRDYYRAPPRSKR